MFDIDVKDRELKSVQVVNRPWELVLNHPIIYVVDDVPEHLKVVSAMLQYSGYEVKTYASGSDLFKEKEICEIGCLLLDNLMPGMSGLEVQTKLLEHNIDIPIVFMSGGSAYANVVDAVRQGALHFLQKPFTRADLIEQVNNAVKESRKRHEVRTKDAKKAILLASLTRRERQVYDLVVAGNINKAISEKLAITLSTVEFHRANMLKKLKVTNLAELIAISE